MTDSEQALVDAINKENCRLKEQLNEMVDKANEKEELATRLKRVIKCIAEML